MRWRVEIASQEGLASGDPALAAVTDICDLFVERGETLEAHGYRQPDLSWASEVLLEAESAEVAAAKVAAILREALENPEGYDESEEEPIVQFIKVERGDVLRRDA